MKLDSETEDLLMKAILLIMMFIIGIIVGFAAHAGLDQYQETIYQNNLDKEAFKISIKGDTLWPIYTMKTTVHYTYEKSQRRTRTY